MAIHEKNKVIEFSYEDEQIDTEDGRSITGYDMVYDGTNPLTPLRIVQKGNVNGILFCHPSLLVEIVDFLRKKGVIQSQVNIRDLAAASRGLLPQQGIPLPVISKKDVSAAVEKDIAPIASWDCSTDADSDQDLDSSTVAPVGIPKDDEASEGIVIKAGQEIDPGSEKVMKERPVIRSRVKDAENDPTGAEREASNKRRSMKKSEKGMRRL
jgi:hypothetical protein